MGGCVALVVAAGRGTRLGGTLPKQYLPLCGEPVLARTLRAFVDHPAVTGVRAVIHPDDRDLYEQAAAGLDVLDPVPGGATRQASVRQGLESLRDSPPETVLIHDAARPFAGPATVDRVLSALQGHAGAVPAVAVSDTLKRTGVDDRRIMATVDRNNLWRAQTPQGFRYSEIVAAHQHAAGGPELTDDAAVAEAFGLDVAVVAGDDGNFKITTAEDLSRAERVLAPGPEWRTGMGFDVHRFGPGDHVMLCGVRISHDAGLVGHSDADVGLHAVTDAVLGGIAAGDIGTHFPPSDPRWQGVASDTFLRHAAERVAEIGGAISHVDVTLICEAPRIGPHRSAMVSRIAEILGLDPHRVSVKATTTERLGFTGRGEGIAAQAVATVTLQRPAAVR